MGKEIMIHCESNRIPVKIVISIFVCIVTLLLISAACSYDSSYSPDATSSATVMVAENEGMDGAALLDKRCSVCHSAETAKRVKKSPAQWEQTVNRMISKGAKLTEEEKKVLLDHLVTTYGN